MFRPTHLVCNNWNCSLVNSNFITFAPSIGSHRIGRDGTTARYGEQKFLNIQKRWAMYWCGPVCTGFCNGRVEMTKLTLAGRLLLWRGNQQIIFEKICIAKNPIGHWKRYCQTRKKLATYHSRAILREDFMGLIPSITLWCVCYWGTQTVNRISYFSLTASSHKLTF